MAGLSFDPSQLIRFQAQEYEKGINDVLAHARYLVNTFHVTVRVPPEILSMVCSHLTTEGDAFSASQVCRHWRGVLISSPSLWTRISCSSVPRTILGLERCKSLPVQLGYHRQSLNVALEKVLHHGNKIASLTIHHNLDRMPLFHRLLVFSRPSVERLYLRSGRGFGRSANDRKPHEIWQDFPSLRELFVCQYSIPVDHFTAPNLAHLALQELGYGRALIVESILGMLRGCPLLETLLISSSHIDQAPASDHSTVSLPRLRSIELGFDEVRSVLISHLHLSQDIAVGFRDLSPADLCGDVPPGVVVTMQRVLGMFDIRCVTLAGSSPPRGDSSLFIRFEGLRASLEITTYAETSAELQETFFDQRGVLFSHSPHIGNVRELHIGGCSFDDRDLRHISVAMPNLVSVSFFRCEDPHVFLLPSHTNHLSPPFPRLERIMLLGPESGLRGVVKKRRECGVPLKTLVVGRESDNGSENDDLEDYAMLGEFVDDLRIGCQVEISEWGTENEVLNLWSNIDIPSPVSSTRNLIVLC